MHPFHLLAMPVLCAPRPDSSLRNFHII
uniref:Uncharacterized protein n=1 Tax=Anguilla anguilla TaxID=7936 RepID=A0A0E9Q7G2_ANGAN